MAVNITSNNNITANKSILEKFDDKFASLFPVPLKEKLFFIQYLSVMLKSGISLSAALKALAKQTSNKNFQQVIQDVSDQVEKGVNLTDSLKKHEKVFGELFVNMVEAGEVSGKLESVLMQLYIQTKKNYELISKVKSAMTYPSVILFAMLGMGIFMMMVVVPQITNMFKELNAELPLATKILIKISDALSQHGILSLLILVLFVMMFIKTINTTKGKYYWQLFLLKMPIFGEIIKKINLARFARTVSSLLKTDIMIIKTFQITANTMGNVHYKSALDAMSEKIKEGGSMVSTIVDFPQLFPPVVTQMVGVGEETGELDTILEEMADFYENEVDQIMTNLPTIIEPLLILVLGCGVGGMAVAIIMPMYSITSSIN